MSTNVLLHLNEQHGTDEACTAFNQLLKENFWIRMHPVYMSWCCRYSDDVYDVQEEVVAEVKRLAAMAGVVGVHAVVQCGNDQPFWFEYDVSAHSDSLPH
jgi:hypothetical protein